MLSHGVPRNKNGCSFFYRRGRQYRAVDTTASELAWIKSLLHELGVVTTSKPTVYYDNVDATYLCLNLLFH